MKALPNFSSMNETDVREHIVRNLSNGWGTSMEPKLPSAPNKLCQNFAHNTVPAGAPISIPGIGKFPLLFEISFSVFTEAVGFVENDKFTGTIRLVYEFNFSKMPHHLRWALESRMGKILSTAQGKSEGHFKLTLLSDI
jgi:hypothetical protein